MPITDKLRTSLGEDAEKHSSLLDSIDEENASLGKRFSTAEEHLKEVKTESAERRRLIRDELKPKIETLEDQVVILQKQVDEFDDSEDKKTIQTLTEQNSKLIDSAKSEFKREIIQISKDEKFQKVSTNKFINLPLDEEGKLSEDKLDEMSNEDILTNQNVLNDLRQIGYFEVVQQGSDGVYVPPASQTPNPTDELMEQYRNEKDPRKRDALADKIFGKNRQTA